MRKWKPRKVGTPLRPVQKGQSRGEERFLGVHVTFHFKLANANFGREGLRPLLSGRDTVSLLRPFVLEPGVSSEYPRKVLEEELITKPDCLAGCVC